MKGKAPVTKRALVQRINRKLSADDEMVKAARGARAQQDLGDFYTVNVSRNYIVAKDVALEDLGRKLGVLKPYEALVE
jgi:hypothetical protein